MGSSFRPIFRTILAVQLICVASTATACIDIVPFEIDDIRHADAVFTGTLIDYHVAEGPKRYSLNKYGLLTFRVDTVIEGKLPRTIQLYWWNSTFSLPESMDGGQRLIVAAVDSGKRLPLRGASAYVQSSMRPDLQQVLQAPCSAPFLLPYTEPSVANVVKVLRGQETGDYDYFRSDEPEEEAEKRPEASNSKNRVWLIAALAFALSFMAIMLSWARDWRNRGARS